MALEKKASEGIALLSMYGDEDDELEDLDEEEENCREKDGSSPTSTPDAFIAKDNEGVSDYANDSIQAQQEDRSLNNNSTPSKTSNLDTSSASATPQLSLVSQQQKKPVGSEFNYIQSQKNRLTIVDYGHEESALSPEAEEGDIVATGRVMYGEQLQNSDGMAKLPTPSTQATPSQSLEPKSGTMTYAVNESESAGIDDAVMVSVEEQQDVDPLDKFLPPPLKAKCSEELQEKITKFLALKKTTGRSFNSEVRNRKEYRNPDFLLHAVTYQDIDQIGSCFSKDVFDPHGYGKSDFYDELEADMRRDMERREQERKKNQKLVQLGNVIPTQKVSTPTPGLPPVAGGILNVTSATLDITTRDGRQNKKSKWDKVDVDQRNALDTGGQGNMSAHAALLSATKAGSGYSAFAQQGRKEAEDRRSSDRKLDRR